LSIFGRVGSLDCKSLEKMKICAQSVVTEGDVRANTRKHNERSEKVCNLVDKAVLISEVTGSEPRVFNRLRLGKEGSSTVCNS
jgi:hypothetical protein